MEKEHRTDKKELVKGIKTMVFSLLSLFMGPILLHSAEINKEKSLYYPMLTVGVLVSGMGVFLIFKGIKIIMGSMFNKK